MHMNPVFDTLIQYYQHGGQLRWSFQLHSDEPERWGWSIRESGGGGLVATGISDDWDKALQSVANALAIYDPVNRQQKVVEDVS